ADPVAGMKLTGKLSSNSTIASIYALDNVPEGDRDSLGRYVHNPTLRFKRTLSEDSYVGMLYAAREREHTNNRVIGLDEQYRLSDAVLLESSGFLSTAIDTPGGAAFGGHTFGARYTYDARGLNYRFVFREISQKFRADMGYVTRTGFDFFAIGLYPKFF